MTDTKASDKVCVVIGASHAGVNFAFALRREAWPGEIHLYDSDARLPYHRPPLSKGYLTNEEDIEKNVLKAEEAYEKEQIHLHLGITIRSINRKEKAIVLEDGKTQSYDKLVLATGARPVIPSIYGIKNARNVFPMRTAQDAVNFRQSFQECHSKNVVVIGGGYIGLETAASLKKLGANVTILEREKRVLSRVTSPEMSNFFHQLHSSNGVAVQTGKNVTAIEYLNHQNLVICDDGFKFPADIIVLGAGIRVNKELAEEIGLEVNDGIVVNGASKTNDDDIYAIGDCTYHYNPHYEQFIRLESVQNAVDQAKVAAASICGKQAEYDSIPWFWSDQYDVKLQMAGLSNGYNDIIIRKDEGHDKRFSVWYFNDEMLLAVDAINNAKAYVLGTKFIKGRQKVNKSKLKDSFEEFSPANLLIS